MSTTRTRLWRTLLTCLLTTTLVGAAASSASAAAAGPLVWAGAPVESLWDGGPPSPPSEHHFLTNAADKGDWAVDLQAAADAEVRLYVAPQDERVPITTRVDQVGAACGGGANGAAFVTVGIYTGNQRVGSITYAHVIPVVEPGDELPRWGAAIGTVAGNLPVNAACWSGPHVHLQMFSMKNYACFNKGYRHEQAVHPTNFVGFTGGNVATGQRQACA